MAVEFALELQLHRLQLYLGLLELLATRLHPGRSVLPLLALKSFPQVSKSLFLVMDLVLKAVLLFLLALQLFRKLVLRFA